MRRIVLGTLQFFFLAFLFSVGWCGWYLACHGFPLIARERLAEELRKSGVALRTGRVTLDPVRGLVAHEVRIMDPALEGRQLAGIDRIRLDIDFAKLIRKQPFLEGIDLRRANLAVPLDKAGVEGPGLEVENLDARILFPPDQVVIAHASAGVMGVRVVVRGSLAHPGAWRELFPRREEERQKESPVAARLLTLARSLRYPAGAPALDVRVEGDCRHPESLVGEAVFSAVEVEGEEGRLKDFVLSLAYRDRVLQLRELSGRDRFGSAHLRGSWDTRGRVAEFDGASGLDLEPLLRQAARKWLREVSFYGPPGLAFSGRYDFGGGGLEATGSVAFGRFAVRSVVFEGARADFCVRGGAWYLADLSVRHRSGEMELDAMQGAEGFRAALVSGIDPDEMVPLLSGKAAAMMSEWKFDEAPRVELEARGKTPSPEACRIDGRLAVGRARFRDRPIRSVESAIRVEDGAVSYTGLTVRREEGSASGNFAYDFKRQEVRLSSVKSTLDPKDVIVWIDPRLLKDLAPYRFVKQPYVEVDGKVDLIGGESTDLRVNASAPGGLYYRFMNKELDVKRASARLHLLGQTLFLKGLDGSLMRGKVTGEAAFSVKPGDPSYRASIAVSDIDFPAVTKLYFGYDESRGRLSGRYDFVGSGPDARAMRGKGRAEVIEGNVFAIPIFGPLSGILNTIVPGLGYNVAKRAGGTFEIAGGVITTGDLVVEGKGFSMLGGGKLYFLDDRMAFDIRINAQGLPGAILFPVSKLFEYRSEGKMSKPVWKAKNLPIL